QAAGVTKEYGRVTALSDFTADITSPATGRLGANGAGKSTFMKIALGLIAATSGQIRVLGLDAATQRGQIRQRVGYMPEHDCLPRDLSAVDLVVQLGQLRGLPRRDAVRRASDVLFAVGLEEERRRFIGTYSLGMKQRTKLAQALVHGPDLVVLDEPTNGLDPAGRAEMLSIIRRLSHELGIGVLVSSHVLEDIERTCNEVLVLHQGRLVRRAPVHEQVGTGPVSIRVTGNVAEFAHALNERGIPTTPDRSGDIRLERADPAILDLVRDLAVERGVGLLRIADEEHRLEDVVVGAMQ
ncbi:MAG TPA: ABC transporter ATP-binding protein, partial [Mycobacteriales bacterium]|nr:ABC transporter ATP-binding protein [Mycobacteriales bacterium]